MNIGLGIRALQRLETAFLAEQERASRDGEAAEINAVAAHLHIVSQTWSQAAALVDRELEALKKMLRES
jgi:hypothetical protein